MKKLCLAIYEFDQKTYSTPIVLFHGCASGVLLCMHWPLGLAMIASGCLYFAAAFKGIDYKFHSHSDE